MAYFFFAFVVWVIVTAADDRRWAAQIILFLIMVILFLGYYAIWILSPSQFGTISIELATGLYIIDDVALTMVLQGVFIWLWSYWYFAHHMRKAHERKRIVMDTTGSKGK